MIPQIHALPSHMADFPAAGALPQQASQRARCGTRGALLGMLIWLGKWVPSIAGLTLERLMNAIETVGFHGLERSVSVASGSRNRKIPTKSSQRK